MAASHRLEQLAALLRRHAVQQRLHLAHLLGHHLHQLVEALGWVGAEHLPPAVHEPLEVRLHARELVPHHVVHVPQHLAQGRHLSGADLLDALLHIASHVLHHLLAQQVHQLLKLALGLWVDEVVPLKLSDGPAQARR